MNYIKQALNNEPVRTAASFVLLVIGGLTVAGIMLPAYVGAVAAVVAAELARRQVTPVGRAEEATYDSYMDGLTRGAIHAKLDSIHYEEVEEWLD